MWGERGGTGYWPKTQGMLTLEFELYFISFICPPKPYFPLEDHKPTGHTSLRRAGHRSHLISGCLVCQACSVPWAPWVPWRSRQESLPISLPQDHLTSSKRNLGKSWDLNTLLPHPPNYLSLFSQTIAYYQVMQPWVFERKIEHLLWHVDYLLTAEGVFTY